MQSIDNLKFGQFLAKLRKEKGMTQKQLAEQLFLSDKAVSKWERGLGFPDILLLLPLSKILNVSTTELLSATRLVENTNLPLEQSNQLIERVILMREKQFNIKDLFFQKETMKKSITKIILFTVISIALNLILIAFSMRFYTKKITFIGIEMVGPTAKFISYLLIGYNFISLLLFLYLTFKKSICYLFSSPTYIISSVFLLWLINYMKQFTNLETALILLQNGVKYFLIITAISLFIIIYGIYRYKIYREKI